MLFVFNFAAILLFICSLQYVVGGKYEEFNDLGEDYCSPQNAYANSGACTLEHDCLNRGGRWQSLSSGAALGCEGSGSKRGIGEFGCCTKRSYSPWEGVVDDDGVGVRSPMCEEKNVNSVHVKDAVCGTGISGAMTSLVGLPFGPCNTTCRAFACSLRGLGCKEEYERVKTLIESSCPSEPLDCDETNGVPDSTCRSSAASFYWGFNGPFFTPQNPYPGLNVPDGTKDCDPVIVVSNSSAPSGCVNRSEPIAPAPIFKFEVLSSDPETCDGADVISFNAGTPLPLKCKRALSLCTDKDDLDTLASALIGEIGDVAQQFVDNMDPCADKCRDGVCLTAIIGCPQGISMIKTNRELDQKCGEQLACRDFAYSPVHPCVENTVVGKVTCPSAASLSACPANTYVGRWSVPVGWEQLCCNMCVNGNCKDVDCSLAPQNSSQCEQDQIFHLIEGKCCPSCAQAPPSAVTPSASPTVAPPPVPFPSSESFDLSIIIVLSVLIFIVTLSSVALIFITFRRRKQRHQSLLSGRVHQHSSQRPSRKSSVVESPLQRRPSLLSASFSSAFVVQQSDRRSQQQSRRSRRTSSAVAPYGNLELTWSCNQCMNFNPANYDICMKCNADRVNKAEYSVLQLANSNESAAASSSSASATTSLNNVYGHPPGDVGIYLEISK